MNHHNELHVSNEYSEQEQQWGRKNQGYPPIESMTNKNVNVAQQNKNQEHPALYGEAQVKDGFGPVYAYPTFPWEQYGSDTSPYGQSLSPASDQSQHEYRQSPASDQSQHEYRQSPASDQLYQEQSQIPMSDPWQHGYNQPQAMMPCCQCCPHRYRNYWW